MSVGVRTPHELDAEALGAPQEQGPRVLSFLFAGDHDSGATDAASQAGPFADAERDMVDSAEDLALLGVPEAQDLVAEQEEGVVRALPDDVHAELFDEEPLRLRPVADADVHVVEA
jgi:hypothetical protein